MNVSDITFLDHMNGYMGSVLFCDLDKGTIHLNALPNRSIEHMWWFVENIVQGLSHETLHLILKNLEGNEASWALHKIDFAWNKENISGFSQFIEKGEENE